MSDGNSPESGARKRGRPKSRERVLKVRVPVSLLPFLERMGHGSAESGAAIWLATLDRRERQIEESIAASLRDLSLAARSLQASAERYEAERKGWLRDLVRVASSQVPTGDGGGPEDPDEPPGEDEPW